ncbi:MAG: hypothetical protein WBG86_23020 [Polyangiales bacterium]
MTRKKIALCMWLIACASMAGCKKDKPKPPPPELSVTLIEAGEQPRSTLRYAIAADTVVRSTLEVRTRTSTTEGEGEIENAFGVLPGVRLSLHAGPTVALPKNGTRYVLRISRAVPILPEGTAIRHVRDVEAGVLALNDTRGRFDLDDRGIVVDSDVPWTRGQERINPRVTIMLGNVRSAVATIPLPAEPVGVGAVWEVRRQLRIWSARVTQVTRYELVDHVDDRLRVRVDVQQNAPSQIADLNPQLELHVRTYKMTASGHALIDLNLPVSLGADMESESEADVALVSPEATEPIQSARSSVLRLSTESER